MKCLFNPTIYRDKLQNMKCQFNPSVYRNKPQTMKYQINPSICGGKSENRKCHFNPSICRDKLQNRKCHFKPSICGGKSKNRKCLDPQYTESSGQNKATSYKRSNILQEKQQHVHGCVTDTYGHDRWPVGGADITNCSWWLSRREVLLTVAVCPTMIGWGPNARMMGEQSTTTTTTKIQQNLKFWFFTTFFL